MPFTFTFDFRTKMRSLLVFICALIGLINATPLNNQDRIIQGEISVKNAHPFMVSLQGTEYIFHICGGSLLNARTVLTAAHCVLYPKLNITHTPDSLMVILGEHHMYRREGTEERHYIDKIIVHETYKSRTAVSPLDSDLALLILKEDVTYTDSIQPICLYRGTEYGIEPPTVAGWGETLDEMTSTYLLEVQVEIQDNARCAKSYGKNFNGDKMLCAGYPDLPTGHKDICQGDSGGPLFIQKNGRKAQIALVSFNSAFGCALKYYPSGYTKLSPFVDWIVANAHGEICLL